MRLKIFSYDLIDLKQDAEEEVNEWLTRSPEYGSMVSFDREYVEGRLFFFIWYNTAIEIAQVADNDEGLEFELDPGSQKEVVDAVTHEVAKAFGSKSLGAAQAKPDEVDLHQFNEAY